MKRTKCIAYWSLLSLLVLSASAASAAAQAVTSRPITRCEFAVLLDALADPFHAFPVDWNGDLVR